MAVLDGGNPNLTQTRFLPLTSWSWRDRQTDTKGQVDVYYDLTGAVEAE